MEHLAPDQAHARIGRSDELDAGSFEGRPNLLYRIDMRTDSSVDTFQPPNRRDADAGRAREIGLLPTYQGPSRFDLGGKYEHGRSPGCWRLPESRSVASRRHPNSATSGCPIDKIYLSR
jgi:hypothetical protein